MRMIPLCIAVALALSACAPIPAVPTSPAAVADQTVLDEKAALGVEAAYSAARTLAELSVDAGWVEGEPAARLAELDRQAYAAVLATRSAYDVGNAGSYHELAREALPVIAQLVAAAKGE